MRDLRRSSKLTYNTPRITPHHCRGGGVWRRTVQCLGKNPPTMRQAGHPGRIYHPRSGEAAELEHLCRPRIRVKWERIIEGLKAGEDSSPSWNTMVTISFPMWRFLSTCEEHKRRGEKRCSGRHTQAKRAAASRHGRHSPTAAPLQTVWVTLPVRLLHFLCPQLTPPASLKTCIPDTHHCFYHV